MSCRKTIWIYKYGIFNRVHWQPEVIINLLVVLEIIKQST